MQLSGIGEYLQKYRKTIAQEDDKRSQVIAVIKHVTGVTVEKDSLSIKKGILTINTNTVIKNEIFMRREKIISGLKEVQDLSVYEIR